MLLEFAVPDRCHCERGEDEKAFNSECNEFTLSVIEGKGRQSQLSFPWPGLQTERTRMGVEIYLKSSS